MTHGEPLIEWLFGRRFVHMWRIEKPAIGYDSRKIAELQRCCHHLTLPHSKPHYRLGIPPIAKSALTIRGIWNKTSLLIGEIYAKRHPETHTNHVVIPSVQCLRLAFIPRAVLYHCHESLTEISVTRGAKCARKCTW